GSRTREDGGRSNKGRDRGDGLQAGNIVHGTSPFDAHWSAGGVPGFKMPAGINLTAWLPARAGMKLSHCYRQACSVFRSAESVAVWPRRTTSREGVVIPVLAARLLPGGVPANQSVGNRIGRSEIGLDVEEGGLVEAVEAHDRKLRTLDAREAH